MAHLDAAKLDEFVAFFKKLYVPNNAVLSIAGDIDLAKTRTLVATYFSEVPKGAPIIRTNVLPNAIRQQIVDTVYDNNIQVPAIFTAYRVPGNVVMRTSVIHLKKLNLKLKYSLKPIK